jgi:hypothetical protein
MPRPPNFFEPPKRRKVNPAPKCDNDLTSLLKRGCAQQCSVADMQASARNCATQMQLALDASQSTAKLIQLPATLQAIVSLVTASPELQFDCAAFLLRTSPAIRTRLLLSAGNQHRTAQS